MVSGLLLSKISLGVCLVSLVFQILGITCPGWLLVNVDLSVISIVSGAALVSVGEVDSRSSVWYVRVCVDLGAGSECTAIGPHDSRRMGFKLTTALTDLSHLNWTEVKIELTAALVLCMAGTIMAVIMTCDPSTVTRKVLTGMSSACMLVSGILILPAVIKVALSIQDAKDALSAAGQVNDKVHVQTSWALILSVIGLIIACMSSVLLLVTMCLYDDASAVVTPHVATPPPPLNIQFIKTPFDVTNVKESDLSRHAPPKLVLPNGTSTLPRIGTKDDEPLAFQNVALSREDTLFDPYQRIPSDVIKGVISDKSVINEADEDNIEEINGKNIPGQPDDIRMV